MSERAAVAVAQVAWVVLCVCANRIVEDCMSGPSKTPVEQLTARGSWRAKAAVVPAGGGMPACPAWLSAESRVAWGELAPELERLGTVTAADALALAMLADSLAQYRAACKEIEADGLVLTAERGPVRNPCVAIRDAAWMRVMKGCREFGLTPVSRSSAPQAPVSDSTERFFEGD